MSDQPGNGSASVRDSKGLLSGVTYAYRPDGSIDWRAMIDNKYLVPNLENFPEGTDAASLDVNELDDAHLLVTLAGIKEMAGLRGYHKVDYDIIEASKEYVAMKCTIVWVPNYETGMKLVQFSGLADAHSSNTSGFGRKFLMAICENRAFSRAARNFLRINVIGQDELDPKEDEIIFDMI